MPREDLFALMKAVDVLGDVQDDQITGWGGADKTHVSFQVRRKRRDLAVRIAHQETIYGHPERAVARRTEGVDMVSWQALRGGKHRGTGPVHLGLDNALAVSARPVATV